MSLVTRARYRGWLSQDERGRLFQIGEGDIVTKVERDRLRFGPGAVIRLLSANAEFADSAIDPKVWRRDEFQVYRPGMIAPDYDLFRHLSQLVGKFVHLEITWRRR